MTRHDLVTLELFHAVARIGSIAGAASHQNLAASAVSKRISDLEADIGTPLFYRKRRGVELTDAGRELLRHTRVLQGQIERMDAEMTRYADGKTGTIRIAANVSSIMQFLPEDLAEFAAAHPDLRIELAEQSSVEVLDAVRTGGCDLGIFSGLTEARGVTVLPYRRDTLVVAARPDHPIASREMAKFRELLEEDFVGLQDMTSIQAHLLRAAAAIGRPLRTRVSVQSFDAICRMVQAGLGIAILPYGAVEPYLRAGDLSMVTLTEPWAKRDLLIAVRDPAALPRHVKLLRDSLTGELC